MKRDKRNRLRICRKLWIAVLLAVSAAAWRCGQLIVWNLVYGPERLWQLLGVLLTLGVLARIADWLEETNAKEVRRGVVVREDQSV